MNSFLEKLADDLLKKHDGDLSALCMVFPTRRAGLYFKKKYAARLNMPAWAPAVFSVEDFVQSLSPYQVGDELDLVFELYEVYRNYFPEEPFDKFYPWGVILLRDFDEIDSALADGPKLFSSVVDLRTIEEQFGLAEEDLSGVREFWKVFFGRNPGAIRKAFHHNWKHLEKIYAGFTAILKKNGNVYKGLALRSVAEGLRDGSVKSGFNHHVFAGFYALSKGEERIISHFLENNTGSVYFDSDSYYVDDQRQEAGIFIRKSPLLRGHYPWKENLLEQDEKKIEMIGVPLQVVQAKTAGQILDGLPHDAEMLNRTAVVLPDEQLLLPVLYALPSHIADLNVTMGYPLQASPLFNLVDSLFELQKSFRQGSFYFKPVIALLSHPYIHLMNPEGINRWLDHHKERPSARIPLDKLTGKQVPVQMDMLFSSFDSLTGALEYFNRFFHLLVETIRNDSSGIQTIEKEYIYYFYTRFKKLEEIIGKYPEQVPVDTFRNLFKEVIRSTRIPFTGEPLKGLQVMGFLETRVLDFENVIILSLNEDILPPASHHPSFIPYNIRKSFGLPTYEDHNAIAAYHFYRLLQRAKNIFLVYNIEVRNFSGGERSRFLLQVENELVRRNPNITLSRRTVPVRIEEVKQDSLDITKNVDVMKELHNYFKPLTSPLKYSKKFSASALGTYIACPLKFYFQYVARLREPDEQEEFLEGRLLGTILHEAMHSLYQPFQTIQKADFDKISAQAERAVDEAIKKEFGGLETLDGKNILMRSVLVELVRQIVESDRRDMLGIKYLEAEFVLPIEVVNGKKVHLYGIIDRVDSVDGTLRVVDYKTGKPDLRKAKDLGSLFQSPDYKEQFQAFFYALLLAGKERNQPIKAGLFRLQRLSEGISFINDGAVISREQLTEFFTLVKQLIQEIFNPDVPFRQTDDETRCTYCAFRDICNR